MKRALSLVLRLGLGALFVIAGALKLRDPAAFATAIANYQLFPAFAAWLAATLPTLELVLGLAVIVAPAPWRAAAAAGMGGLLGMFTVAASAALARHIDIACGCFGSEGGTISALTVARDLALVAAAVAVAVMEQRALTAPRA